jgi:nucleotide-binding universal stress UspA family protein
MFRRLLVPLDGSRLAEAALPAARFLAARSGARVVLLHAVERSAPATVHGDSHLKSAEEAESYLERIARESFPPEVAVEWHVHRRQIADVAHSLADHADELEPDLILMVSHGPRRLPQRLFGTIAQQVIQRTITPVLLLHAGVNSPAGQPEVPPFRQVVLPLDGTPAHEAALPLALEIAAICGAPVRMVMVVPTPGTLEGSTAAVGQLLPAATSELLNQAERSGVDYLARQVQRAQAAGVRAAATIARGHPADVLRQTIVESGADLVALGTHGTAGAQAFWSGSIGQRLLDLLSTSFLLVPVQER